MTCRHHRRVVLVFICGVTKVHNFHICVPQCPFIPFLRTKTKTVTLLIKLQAQTECFQTLAALTSLDKYLRCSPFQSCTPYRSLNQWIEYSQASDLCGSACSCVKLKDKTTLHFKPNCFFKKEKCTHASFFLLTSHCSDDLVGHVPDVLYRERLEVVFFEEIVGAEAKQLKGNTYVTVVVKPVQHVHTSTKGEESHCWCKVSFLLGRLNTFFSCDKDIRGMKWLRNDLLSLIRVEGLQLLKHLYLRHSCLAVAVYIFNDLQSYSSSITADINTTLFF